MRGPAAPRAPPCTGASQKPRGIERGALRSPVPTLPGDPVRSWGAPAKLEERWLRLWDDGRCRGGSSPRMGSAGLGRARGKGGTSGGPWAVFGERSDPAFTSTRECTPRTSRDVRTPRETGEGCQLLFTQQQNPADKESQTGLGATWLSIATSPSGDRGFPGGWRMDARSSLSP